jgi:hypothetical protein
MSTEENKENEDPQGVDEEFFVEVKCMMALSFLEKEEIPVYFAELYLELSPDARLLADWVNKHYENGGNNRTPSF